MLPLHVNFVTLVAQPLNTVIEYLAVDMIEKPVPQPHAQLGLMKLSESKHALVTIELTHVEMGYVIQHINVRDVQIFCLVI